MYASYNMWIQVGPIANAQFASSNDKTVAMILLNQ